MNNMNKLCAGVARSEITADGAGAAVNDPLYARALVLDDGTTKVVIIAMDVTAIGGRKISREMLPDVGDEFLSNLRRRIESELKIPGCNVLVNASHTHPAGRMLCSDEEQVNRTFDAVRRAAESMVEVRIGSGIGHEDRISMNRTLRLKNGKHWTIRHTNPCPPDEDVEGLGPVDHEIGVIRIDRLDGTPLAVAYNFACHLLFGDYQGRITANIPGYASKVIEETIGGGAMALFLQGAAGDVCDVHFKDFNRPRDVKLLGTMLGQSTLQALGKIETKNATLNVISETIKLPRRTDIPERIKALQKEQSELLESLRFTTLNFKSFLPLYLKYADSSSCPHDGDQKLAEMNAFNRKNIDKYLRNIRAMEALSRIEDDIATLKKHQAINDEAGEPTIDAEVMGIKLGDCILISAPVEALVEIGLNIKKASPCKHTFMAAFSNGYMHYGPPASYYDKGGYEVTECLLAPEWQAVYEKTAGRMIRRLSV